MLRNKEIRHGNIKPLELNLVFIIIFESADDFYNSKYSIQARNQPVFSYCYCFPEPSFIHRKLQMMYIS
jgi:hypothetical protein